MAIYGVKGADIVSLVLAVVALVMHTVGHSFPYWWRVDYGATTGTRLLFNYGIWAIRECTNDSCVSVRSKMHDDRSWLIGPAVLVVLSSVLLLVTVVTHAWFLVNKVFSSIPRKLCVLLSAGAGGIIILAVLIFYKKKAGLHPSHAPETSEGGPDWALFLSTFGGILGVFNSILIGCVVKREYMKRKENWLFGIKNAQELEIHVNALRQGELVQGRGVNKVSLQPDGGKTQKPPAVVMNDHL